MLKVCQLPFRNSPSAGDILDAELMQCKSSLQHVLSDS